MSKEVKLSVNNLKVSFRTDAGKVQAVRDISFNLYKGETLAIVGESGSGKSVTSKAIMGISAVNGRGNILSAGEKEPVQLLCDLTDEGFIVGEREHQRQAACFHDAVHVSGKHPEAFPLDIFEGDQTNGGAHGIIPEVHEAILLPD